MTLRHMKIFVAVCENDGVTAAAKKLFIAQPSVSLAIRELEEYYGIRLFDRISRKLYITEQGKEFLKYASYIVSLFDELESKIKNWDQAGILRIGSSITIGNYLLPSLVKEFTKKHPQIKVQVTIDNSEEVEKKVIKNKVDFGLIEGISHSNQIKKIKFRKDKLVLICGKNHPLSKINEVELDELIKYDFILREKGSGSRELFDSTMLIHDVKIEPMGESISTRAIIQSVIAGLGLSVVPYLLVKEDMEKGNIHGINIKGMAFNRDYYIIHHKNKYLSDLASDFISTCKKEEGDIGQNI